MNNKFSNLCIVMGAMSLTACAGLTVPKSIKPNYVMTANGPQDVGFGNPIPVSLIQQFADDYNVAWCKSQSLSTRKFINKTYASSKKFTETPTDCSTINASLTEAKSAQKMTKSGFRLMDSVCSAYFRRLGNQDQDLDFYSQTTNNLSGMTSAILGATGVNAKTLAITNTFFAGTEAGFETFDAIYHFSPDLQAVENMVARAGKTYEGELRAKANPQDFYDAVQAVEDYQRICQTSNIRALVNQAIESADLSAAPRTARNRLVQNLVSSTQINDIVQKLGVTNISPETLAWLAAGATGEVSAADMPKLVALLTAAGIASPTTKFNDVRNWLDNLARTEPTAYEALSLRIQERDVETLPPAAATVTNNDLRKKLIETNTESRSIVGPINPFIQ